MRLEYSMDDLVRVARRWNNPRRSYLLVDPLQAKHVPASPSAAAAMMGALGDKVREAAPDAKLAVGFAETATAIGAAVAARLGPGTAYVHTTREPVAGPAIGFSEEHSHAPEHVLSLEGMERALADTGAVVFVDDELTTGKTLRNMILALEGGPLPELGRKRMIAACVVNRMGPEDMSAMRDMGVEAVSLLDAHGFDPEPVATAWSGVMGPGDPEAAPQAAGTGASPRAFGRPAGPDPRMAGPIGGYMYYCAGAAAAAVQKIRGSYRPGASLRVLGTEECMHPAIMAGRMLEMAGYRVRCHATTRSPIGVCRDPGYPIRSALVLPSFYDPGRTTYLYDIGPADAWIILTDAPYRKDVLDAVAARLPGPCMAFYMGQEAGEG